MAPTRPPSVDAILRAANGRMSGRDHAAIVAEARAVIDDERSRLASGHGGPARDVAELATELEDRLTALDGVPGPQPVINATGVILHTNLGRAPWATAAIEAAIRAAAAPSMLEMDPETGRRGRRFRAVEDEVTALTGAEDALITNNNAMAVALAVGLAGRGGKVVVSRGELVEIGGGVRIPEIIKRAGAVLVEVGTTNRTRVADYEAVLADGKAKVVLRVHPSNFQQAGFVEAPDAAALARAAHAHGAIVVDDLGSGALLDTERFGLAHEPTPRERLEAGADLVTFSGDKLVGGPQAGIVAGRAEVVDWLRRDPMARATRPDKSVLAALAATLRLYRAGTAITEIPIWRQLAATTAELDERAASVLSHVMEAGPLVADGSNMSVSLGVATTESTIGGGSLPGQVLESRGLAIKGVPPDRLLAELRAGAAADETPGVIGRIVDDAVVLDLRTVEPEDDPALADAIRSAARRATRPGIRS
ncbi:MAG TPA: L-seryl-tRNA(Sec) selenium transferase [Candidatus Limnocylindrales bacterium]|nr:L-seryl-tRNA(Sec) selenium transferase [Candidatus Limnocylindrales bacterium]